MTQVVQVGRWFQHWGQRISINALLFLFFFSIYAFTMSGFFEYGGEIEKYRVAQSIVDRHSFSIRPIVTRGATGTGGQTYSIYEFGQIALEIPFYALGRAVYSFFPTPDVNWITLLFVGILNPILTALTCVLLFNTVTSFGFRATTAFGVTLLFGLATIAFPYSRGLDREPLLSLLILLSFYASWMFVKTRATRWLILAGGFAGYLVFTKFIQAMVFPFLFAYILIAIYQERRAANINRRQVLRAIIQGGVLFLLPAIVFLSLQVLYAFTRFGTFYSGIGGTSQNIVDVILRELSLSNMGGAIAGLLFSPERSIFIYSPPAILFLFTWVSWFKRRRGEALLLLGLVIIEFVSTITRQEWWGGPRWGPRYMVQATPLLMIPLAVIESKRGATRRWWLAAYGTLFVLGFVIQGVGALTDERATIDITGRALSFLLQADFLLHGALNSLVLYLSPGSFGFQINPFGIFLIAIAVIVGIGLVKKMNSPQIQSSAKANGAFLAGMLAIMFVALGLWIVIPYQNIVAGRGNSRFVAGENYLAEGRTCEATGMFVAASEWQTTYQRQTIERLNQLAPHAPGTLIPIDDPMHWIDITGTAKIENDPVEGIGENPSMRFRVVGERDATAIISSSPIDAQPNMLYELSGWFKSSAIYGTGYGVVSIFEDNGNWENGRSTDIQSMDETHGWQPFRDSITTLPTTKRLFVKAGLFKTFGTLWVDGIQLVQVDSRVLYQSDPMLPCN